MKLDLGGGSAKGDGWLTVDINPRADIVHDLDKFPYPFNGNGIDEIRTYHTLEHLKEPLKVMEEVYRILKPGGLIEVRVPWWKLDQYSNPWHRHWFRPKWFRMLNPEAIVCINEMKNICKCNFRVDSTYILKGNGRFWKKYELRVKMVAIK